MQDQALRIASHIPNPLIVAACALGFAALAFVAARRRGRPLTAWAAAVVIVILGVTPLVVSTIARRQAVYRIRVVVLEPDKTPVDYAQVKSSYSGDLKMVEGGWQLDIPAQARPAEGKVTFSASVNDEYVTGKSTIVLAQDYYPTATVQLVAETSAKVRGVVVDEGMKAVAGATVSIVGYPEVAVTDKMGNFVLPGHAGKGQIVEIRAQKDQMIGKLSAPAGKVVEVILGSD